MTASLRMAFRPGDDPCQDLPPELLMKMISNKLSCLVRADGGPPSC